MNRNTAPAPQAFEALEGRQLFAVTIGFIAPDTLTFTGDFQADVVDLRDNGGPAGTISGAASNAAGVMIPFGPVPGIRNVQFNMGTNNDRVRYTFTGDMLVGGARYISGQMGDDADAFHLDMAADIDLGPNAYVNCRISGTSGDDLITTKYRGTLAGQFVVSQDGSKGNDRLFSDAFLDAGSTGRLTLYAFGGTEDDYVDMRVHKALPFDPVVINAFASGGAGLGDKLIHTLGVVNDGTFEGLAVVP